MPTLKHRRKNALDDLADGVLRLVADRERLLDQFGPTLNLLQQHDEHLRRIAQMVETSPINQLSAQLAEMAKPADELGRTVAEMNAHWRSVLDHVNEMARLPREAVAQAETIAEAFRRSMPVLPKLDPAAFGGAWSEDLAESLTRLHERATGIAAQPEGVTLDDVEALAGDIGTVTAVTPPEAQAAVNTWLRIVMSFVLGALVVNPAQEALRHAVVKLLVVLLVIAGDSTLPTPPQPPVLRQPEVLAPLSPPAEPFDDGAWRLGALPEIVRRAGPKASERVLEFFTAEIRNPNTRAAYDKATSRFFTWCQGHKLELVTITPFAVATYIEKMQGAFSTSTVKQHLAAIRRLFEFLVVGQIVPSNPASSVRGPKQHIKKGQTPGLKPDEARHLLESINVADLSGLRDRALLAVMIYCFARVSAVVNMDVADVFGQGRRRWVRLHEKGGKRHELPLHHKADEYLNAYLEATGIADARRSPLWRTMTRRRALSGRRMSRVDVFRMIKRRVRAIGLDDATNCHTFRATGITAYLLNGGSLERAQAIAAHESPRTTRLYDRTVDEITSEDIDRIKI